MTLDRTRLPGQARYWTLHCCINALPSFLVAIFYLQMISQPLAVVAMLLAIATFIAVYTVLTSIDGLFSDSESLLARALKVGVKIRMWVSIVSLPFLLPSPLALFVPDVWAGMLSAGAVNWFGKTMGFPGFEIDASGGDPAAIAVYATTMIEGLIISFMLIMLSFFSLLVLQSKDRKRRAMEVVLPPEAS